MTKLEELKAVRDNLGEEFEQIKKTADAAVNAARSKWCDAIVAVQRVERFAQLDAEYAAEKLKKEQNGNA